ncbi:hypothetical protein HYH03_006825 [Edaphochlamys debaryana]|uniref:mRNA export factor GLE1 n=1 Tax=Edaphochlamys debaryana TaxID=47281 RepID=A0A836C168_9CHLO|nr:hypothetical protein HYH03_006825 [Edaphochlamys debaryana]|eukprot:KAG2495219.1 hypothetical protein HYH03_006825 [Edaphochlamys debaryana]
MSSPAGDVVKRLNFGADARTPLSGLVSARRGRPRATPLPGAPTTPGSSHGIVRYGLPEEELYGADRHSGSRTVSYRVPDDDEESDEEVQSTAAPLTALTRPDAVEEQKRLLEQQLLVSLEALQHNKQASWQLRLAEVEQQLATKLNVVTSSALRKQDDLQRADQEALRQQQQRRAEVLEAVQRTHRTEASLQEQQIKRLVEQREEERRKEEERQRREAEERRAQAEREAAERARQQREAEEAERAHKAKEETEAQRKQAEAQAEAQKAEADKKSKEAAKASKDVHPCLRVSPAAATQAAELAASLAALQASVQPLLDDEACKKQRRDIEKKLTVHVQQVSGTQAQVQTKCTDLYRMMSVLQGPWRSYAVLTLCNKVLKQQELVQTNNKAAFPLALVVVRVSQVIPELLPTMVALMHKSCPLSVPRGYVHDTARISNNAYYRGMGFEELEDPSAPTGKAFESPDAFARRLEGLMLLYGALMQVDDPNPHGVAHAWSWLARCLNQLPPDRFTAKAVVAVLRVAGYSLFLRYRGQFVKLLACMQREFVPQLRKAEGDDIGALATLLDSYVIDGLFRKAPEGRDMPRFDMSSLPENRA